MKKKKNLIKYLSNTTKQFGDFQENRDIIDIVANPNNLMK